MGGSLHHFNQNCKDMKVKPTKIPFIFVYSITYIAVLSSLDHKELRFYTPVIQLGCLSQGYMYEQLYILSKNVTWHKTVKFLVITLMMVQHVKFIGAMWQYPNQYWSMLDQYVVLNQRSPHIA